MEIKGGQMKKLFTFLFLITVIFGFAAERQYVLFEIGTYPT
jgi:hypothetical protein